MYGVRTDSFLMARPRCMQCMQRGKNVTALSYTLRGEEDSGGSVLRKNRTESASQRS